MRRSKEEDRRPEFGDRVDSMLGSFLRRHPRFLLHLAIAFLVLVLLAVLMAKLTGSHQ